MTRTGTHPTGGEHVRVTTRAALGLAGLAVLTGGLTLTPAALPGATSAALAAPAQEATAEAPGGTRPEGASAADPGEVPEFVRAVEVAAALETDPIYAEPGQESRLDAATTEELREALSRTEYPMYVLLLDDMGTDGQSYYANSDFLGMVAAAKGDVGLYSMLVRGSDIRYERTVADDSVTYTTINSQTFDHILDPAGTMSEGEWLLDVAHRMEDPSIVTRDDGGAPAVLSRWGSRFVQMINAHPWISLTVFVAVLLALGAVIWWIGRKWPRHGKKYTVPKTVIDAAKRASREKLSTALGADAMRVAERLESLRTEDLSAEQADRVQHGLDAYALARRIADDPASEADDLIGALVLFELAENDLARVEAPAGGVELHRPCAVNPGHGNARGEVVVADQKAYDGSIRASLEVPACAKCMRDHGNSNPLQWLRVDGKPYLERDTVWARTLFGATDADLVKEAIRERALG